MKTMIICTRCQKTYEPADPESEPGACHFCEYPGIVIIQYPAEPVPERVVVNVMLLRKQQAQSSSRRSRGVSASRG